MVDVTFHSSVPLSLSLYLSKLFATSRYRCRQCRFLLVSIRTSLHRRDNGAGVLTGLKVTIARHSSENRNLWIFDRCMSHACDYVIPSSAPISLAIKEAF